MKRVDVVVAKVLKFNLTDNILLIMDNYFEIFNLDINYNLDQDQLEKTYHKLQSKIHPDKQDISQIEHSIALNNAYKNLNDDFLRACHILSLKNIDILHDEKAVTISQQTLLETLEIQEKISLENNFNNIEKLQNIIILDFSKALRDSMQLYQQNKIRALTQFLIKAKYLKKCLDDLKQKKSQIKNAA